MIVYTTGAFIVPLKINQDGFEKWVWVIDSFEDDTYADGKYIDFVEIANTKEELMTNRDNDDDY